MHSHDYILCTLMWTLVCTKLPSFMPQIKSHIRHISAFNDRTTNMAHNVDVRYKHHRQIQLHTMGVPADRSPCNLLVEHQDRFDTFPAPFPHTTKATTTVPRHTVSDVRVMAKVTTTTVSSDEIWDKYNWKYNCAIGAQYSEPWRVYTCLLTLHFLSTWCQTK